MRFLLLILALQLLNFQVEADSKYYKDVSGCYRYGSKHKGGYKYVRVHKYKHNMYNVDTDYAKCRLYKCKETKKGLKCWIAKHCKVNGGKTVTFYKKGKSYRANRLLKHKTQKVKDYHCEKDYGYMHKKKRDYSNLGGCYRSGYGKYNQYRKRSDYGKNKHGYDYDVYMHDGSRCYLEKCSHDKFGSKCYYSYHCKKHHGQEVYFKKDHDKHYIDYGVHGKKNTHADNYCCDYLYEHTPKKHYQGGHKYKWDNPKHRNNYMHGYKGKDKYQYKHQKSRYQKDYKYRMNRLKSSNYKYKSSKYNGKKYNGNMLCEANKGYKQTDYKYNDGYKYMHRYHKPSSKYATNDYKGDDKDYYGYGSGHSDYDDDYGYKYDGREDMYLGGHEQKFLADTDMMDADSAAIVSLVPILFYLLL